MSWAHKAACRKTTYPPHNDCTFWLLAYTSKNSHLISSILRRNNICWSCFGRYCFLELPLCYVHMCTHPCLLYFWLSASSLGLELLLIEDLSHFDAPHTGARLSTLLLKQRPRQGPFPDFQSLHAYLCLP